MFTVCLYVFDIIFLLRGSHSSPASMPVVCVIFRISTVKNDKKPRERLPTKFENTNYKGFINLKPEILRT